MNRIGSLLPRRGEATTTGQGDFAITDRVTPLSGTASCPDWCRSRNDMDEPEGQPELAAQRPRKAGSLP